MSNRSKRSEKTEGQGSPGWMTTYGDMMTLLLCFFVLLYSFSVIDVERFTMIISTLRTKLGVLDGGRTVTRDEFIEAGQRFDRLGELELSRMEFEELYFQIVSYLEEEGLDREVEVFYSEDGLLVRFTGRVLFDLGRAELRVDARTILDQLADFLEKIDNYILVEGHTCDMPISTEEFPSNWELSTSRATNVVRYFVEIKGLEPDRFSAAGYGEYRPLRPNDSEENRSYNRRVDIVIRRDPGFVPEEGEVVSHAW